MTFKELEALMVKRGQFVLECIKHSGATVKFSGNRFFGSLDEVAEYLAGLEEV